MLQRQRVFSLTNTIINCLFMALLLLCGVYFISFWIEMKPSFLETMVSIVNIAAWCVTGLSVAMVLLYRGKTLIEAKQDIPFAVKAFRRLEEAP